MSLPVEALIVCALGERYRETFGELTAAASQIGIRGRDFPISDRQYGLDPLSHDDRPDPEELRAGILQRLEETVAGVLATRNGQAPGLCSQGREHVVIELDARYRKAGQPAAAVIDTPSARCVRIP